MSESLVRQRWAAPSNAVDLVRSAARNARGSLCVIATLRTTITRFLLALIAVAAMCGGQTNAHNNMATRAPKEVSEWTKLFESSALYRHNYGQMFEDWVEICICCFANQTMEPRYLEIVKRYTREELDVMAQLMGLLIVIQEDHTAEGGWYDALGNIYEYLAHASKAKALGQFFTPEGVCDMMARMTTGETGPGDEETSCDPACGSGRMLLAIHALNPTRAIKVGADVDPVCAKMCALNFWLHGIRGEVACMDSIRMTWRFAYQTHPRYLYPFITYLGDERKEESLTWHQCKRILQPTETAALPVLVKLPAMPDLFSQVAAPAPLYGEAARRHRYHENEKRQVLGTLKDIADVLERNKADEEFAKNKKRIALELRLRGVELKGDAVSCYLGKTWCRFPWWNIKDVIRTAQTIYKTAA